MDQQRLARLLDRYVDESLTAEEREEFEQILLGSEEARRMFWEHTRFHALLREFGERSWGAQLAASPALRPEGILLRLRRYFRAAYDSHLGWALATAMAVLIMARVWFWTRPAIEPTTSAIAVLTQAVDAEWAEGGDQRNIGSSLAPGWLKLKSGMAQVEFISGARVILEGPAEFQLISPMEAFCQSGKLTAEVPPPAHGFKVRSPGATVVDLGTAFGLNVQKSGEALVQVLRGEVEVHHSAGAPRGLVEGQGLHVGPDGTVEDIGDAPDVGFPSSELLAQRAALGWQKRRDAWMAATQKFSADPSLAIHYTFEETSSWSRLLHNSAKNAPPETDGSIVGCRWSEGHWPGKRALEFHGVTDRVRFNLPGKYEAITMASWVRIDSLDLELNGLMMCEGWRAGALHWQFTRKGMVRLGVNRSGDFDTSSLITPDRFGQWVHLAVVCDRVSGRVEHYIDGQRVSSGQMSLDVPLQLGNAELGSWSPGGKHDQRPIRNLVGGMDEFYLFTRALNEQEIRDLYQASGSAL